MRKGINKMVGIRVAAALAAVVLFSFVMTGNIMRIQRSEENAAQADILLDRAFNAEVAHYKWATNLSNALYSDMEFTGSMDPTACTLGQWLYGEPDTGDEVIQSLRDQLEPLHRELHESASQALDLITTSSRASAQRFYQTTIFPNVSTLVEILDQVVERGEEISAASSKEMDLTIKLMHITSIVGLSLSLISLISLVLYVLRQIVRPIMLITYKIRPIQEGRLELDLQYKADN